jgi:Transposase DDE domain group 1
MFSQPKPYLNSRASGHGGTHQAWQDGLQVEAPVEPILTLGQVTMGVFSEIDGTSTHEMRSDQLRLYFSSFAYVLVQTLRRLGLKGTALAKAQCDTIRLKLFKIGAHIRQSVRRVCIAFSESYPYAALFAHILRTLQRIL